MTRLEHASNTANSVLAEFANLADAVANGRGTPTNTRTDTFETHVHSTKTSTDNLHGQGRLAKRPLQILEFFSLRLELFDKVGRVLWVAGGDAGAAEHFNGQLVLLQLLLFYELLPLLPAHLLKTLVLQCLGAGRICFFLTFANQSRLGILELPRELELLPLLVQQVAKVSIDPNVTYATGKDVKKLVESLDVAPFVGNVCYEDRGRRRSYAMRRGSHPRLSDFNVVDEFLVDDVAKPNNDNDCHDDMAGVSIRVGGAQISPGKPVEAAVVVVADADRVETDDDWGDDAGKREEYLELHE
ncbi:hypothetical protein HDK64DRAFT_276047 [Phyllosticta capitalensis]